MIKFNKILTFLLLILIIVLSSCIVKKNILSINEIKIANQEIDVCLEHKKYAQEKIDQNKVIIQTIENNKNYEFYKNLELEWLTIYQTWEFAEIQWNKYLENGNEKYKLGAINFRNIAFDLETSIENYQQRFKESKKALPETEFESNVK